MINIDIFKELSLFEHEYVFLVKTIGSGSSSFPVTIPKLMPFISLGEKESNVTFDSNIFVNDPSCKPSVSKQFVEKGSVNVKVYPNVSFEHLEGPEGILQKGTKLRLMFMNHNVRDFSIVHS